jgi:hypothetical protein
VLRVNESYVFIYGGGLGLELGRTSLDSGIIFVVKISSPSFNTEIWISFGDES